MDDQHAPSNLLVVVGTSQDPSSARSSFPADTKDFWCIATLPLLAADDVTTDTWDWADPDQPAPKHWGMKRVSGWGSVRGGPMEGPSGSGISGPLSPGRYSCRVEVNGQLFGEATFTVEAAQDEERALD